MKDPQKLIMLKMLIFLIAIFQSSLDLMAVLISLILTSFFTLTAIFPPFSLNLSPFSLALFSNPSQQLTSFYDSISNPQKKIT